MTQQYLRDLQRRVGAIERHCCPEEELLPTVVVRDEDGLPIWVHIPTLFDWSRKDDEPIPARILAIAEVDARSRREVDGADGPEEMDEAQSGHGS